MQLFIASNNGGKVERFKRLLLQVDPDIELKTPKDFGIEIEVEETGKTLRENAELKVRAYFGKVDLPILSNDAGFYVEGEGFVEAPKRVALEEGDEQKLSKEEIAQKLLNFWKGIATKHGGRVNAAWIEMFALLLPDGTLKMAESRREVILTDQEFGKSHIQLPIHSTYISKATMKPAVLHTPEEEILEMQPVILALREVLGF
jgi:inosine/xanthosine triphosphate pyrophosphatase family protein